MLNFGAFCKFLVKKGKQTDATLGPTPGTGVGAGATMSTHVDCLLPTAFIA